MAHWWDVDPEVVSYAWSIVDFFNRAEYMWLKKEYAKETDKNGYLPGEVPWTPKNRQK